MALVTRRDEGDQNFAKLLTKLSTSSLDVPKPIKAYHKSDDGLQVHVSKANLHQKSY